MDISARYQTTLNELRIKLNLTQQDLAAKVGTTQGSIGHWCIGKYRPVESYIPKLAEAFNVSVPEMIQLLNTTYDEYHNGELPVVPSSVDENRTVVDMRSPHTFKDNFWSRKRVECNMKVTEVGEAIDQPYKRVGQYFTGQTLPDDDIIHALCDLFDVDFVTGKQEFINANKIWVGEHDKDLISGKIVNRPKKSAANKPTKKKKSIAEKPEPEKIDNPTKPLDADTIDYIATKIYGKVDYQEFFRIIDLLSLGTELSKLLDMVYGRVDFNVFMLLDDLSRGIDIEPAEPEF